MPTDLGDPMIVAGVSADGQSSQPQQPGLSTKTRVLLQTRHLLSSAIQTGASMKAPRGPHWAGLAQRCWSRPASNSTADKRDPPRVLSNWAATSVALHCGQPRALQACANSSIDQLPRRAKQSQAFSATGQAT